MDSEPALFQNTGRQVSNRLFQIGVMQWLNKSLGIIAVTSLVLVILLRLLGVASPGLEWSLIILPPLLAIGAIIGIRHATKPEAFEALAAWEEKSGGKSILSSAEFFETVADRTDGQRLHMERATKIRDERLQHLKTDLPVPKPHWSWLLILPAILFTLTPFLKPAISAEDLVITDEMRDRAEEEAEKLEEEKKALADLEALTDKEKEQVEKLSEMLEETSEFLADAGSKTSREVLEELEARAREAERMAKEMGADDEWASEEMLEEMSQHADTVELAEAIREKDADLSADQSDKIADKLQSEDLTNEAENRIDTALERTMTKATEEDKDRPVGEHVGNASTKMQKDQARPAGQEFRYLADHFRDLARRERAQEKLEELAEKLRESGNNIAQSQLQQMQQLGGSQGNMGQSPQQMSPPAGAQSLAQSPPMVPQNMGGMPQMQQPGMQGMQGQQGMQQAPVPGMSMQQMPQGAGQQGQQMGMGQLGQGQQPGQQGQGALMAPVPGQTPGAGNSPGMMLGGSPMSAPGLQAGFGTAQMGTDATQAIDSKRDSMVDAQINEDGESVVRTVQGGVRSEQAQRQTQEQNREFIAVEEEALDEKALPVSRKDQVLKYFTALRQQFEETN